MKNKKIKKISLLFISILLVCFYSSCDKEWYLKEKVTLCDEYYFSHYVIEKKSQHITDYIEAIVIDHFENDNYSKLFNIPQLNSGMIVIDNSNLHRWKVADNSYNLPDIYNYYPIEITRQLTIPNDNIIIYEKFLKKEDYEDGDWQIDYDKSIYKDNQEVNFKRLVIFKDCTLKESGEDYRIYMYLEYGKSIDKHRTMVRKYTKIEK